MISSLTALRGSLPRINRISRSFFASGRSAAQLQTHRSHSSGSSNNNNDWKRNGTPELFVGFSILGFLAIEKIIELQQTNDRKKFMQSMKTVLRHERMALDEENDEGKEIDGSKKALFKCTIRRIPKNFDGSMALKGTKVGEVVEVLEERVGPDGMYHKVRHENKNGSKAIGWFPISCLELNI